MADKRTIRDFAYSGDLWSVVDAWAQETKYVPVGGEREDRVYQRGVGFWVAPQMLSIRRDGDNVHLEAWIRAGLFVRLMSLFILPSEMHIGPGGMRAALPRKIARGMVNDLLERLGQPPIE